MVETMFKYKTNAITEKEIKVGEIPCSVFTPDVNDAKSLPTIFYYHGWSSNRARQRFIGAVFASFGYLTILPDAINHGERGRFDNYNKALYKYFLPTIMQNLSEFSSLKDYALKNLNADKNRLAVSGHSMGGYTSAGIFTHNSDLKTAVIFNGACDWQNAILETERRHKTEHIELSENEKNTDPATNIKKIINRPLFLLHGLKDTLVPFEVQKSFYEKLLPQYTDKTKLKFMEVERMNHYISVQMFNEALIWLSKNLSTK